MTVCHWTLSDQILNVWPVHIMIRQDFQTFHQHILLLPLRLLPTYKTWLDTLWMWEGSKSQPIQSPIHYCSLHFILGNKKFWFGSHNGNYRYISLGWWSTAVILLDIMSYPEKLIQIEGYLLLKQSMWIEKSIYLLASRLLYWNYRYCFKLPPEALQTLEHPRVNLSST